MKFENKLANIMPPSKAMDPSDIGNYLKRESDPSSQVGS